RSTGTSISSSVVHIPCRSGSPHAVFECVHLALLPFVAVLPFVVVWPARDPAPRTTRMTAISNPPANVRLEACSASRLLAEMSIQQLLRKFYAFELQQLRVLFDMPVQRHPHRP